ncbi:MAG TPA: PfkB family carbohydrate kinase [Sphingobacterium sp.]|nr:PfkB family carbohydrate kinase [Sphingobacterium sp.]
MKNIQLIQSFSQKNILVLGDLIIDEYIEGYCSRYANEANIPIMDVEKNTRKLGGAGNVAANLSALGAKTTLCAVTGDDFPLSDLETLLQQSKIHTGEIVFENDRTTLVKTRFSIEGNMFYRVDRGTTDFINKKTEEEIIKFLEKEATNFDAILISDYNKGLMTPAIIETLVKINKEHQMFIAMDGREYQKYARVGLSLITPNFKEASQLVKNNNFKNRLEDACTWGKKLYEASQAKLCALTLDKDGVMLFEKDKYQYHSSTKHVERSYVCGAGDTFFAAQALSLISGSSLYQSLELANKAAWIRIQKKDSTVCTQQELLLADVQNKSCKLVNDPLHLKTILEQLRKAQTIVFTNGCFDIFHSGHVNYLRKAKELGDILIVAINKDDSVSRLKGENRPVNKLKDRVSILEALSCVDYIIPFGKENEDNPKQLIEMLQPDIYVKGNDYKQKKLKEKAALEKAACEIHFLPMVPHQSTTKIINRVQIAIPISLQKSS